MLILVAVTIQVVINSGLLKTAGDAVSDYKNEQEKESNNSNVIINGVEYESIEDYMEEQHNWAYTDKPIEYPTLVTEITSANYGDYVRYNIDYDNDGNSNDDWRIFYNDGECIYLISSDFVRVQEYESGYSGYGDYSLNLDAIGYKNPESAIDFLSNKENWTSLKDSTLANYAVGTPNLEMFVNSWNQNHVDESINLMGNSIDGYEYSYNNNCSMASDSLYSITNEVSALNRTLGIWIASKDTNNKIYMYASSLQSVSSTQGNEKFDALGKSYYIGIRPIICLKQEVILKSGEGTMESPFEIGVSN